MAQLTRNEIKSCLKLGCVIFTVAVLICLVPVVRHVMLIREAIGLSREVQQSITDMKRQRPADVPERQWDLAVAWTSNIIAQVFFGYDEKELPGLRKLAEDLEERRKGQVDLTTLQWIWDEAERWDSSPDTCALRFRDVRLLIKDPITDESLPSLWSLQKAIALDLHATEITDASIPVLSQLDKLRSLSVRGTAVTADGVAKLQAALPQCEIDFGDGNQPVVGAFWH